MKFKRLLLGAVVGALCSAGPVATAAATPLTLTINSDEQIAVDGADVYWIRPSATSDSLYRGSLLDGSKVKLATFDTEKNTFVDEIAAGGGFVAVQLSELEGSGKSVSSVSEVVRYARDGSSVSIAKGASPLTSRFVKRGGRVYRNDCGTSALLESVSPAGGVVLTTLKSDRNSPHCGGLANIDHWSGSEVLPSGIARTIYAADVNVKSKPSKGDDGALPFFDIDVNGDTAVMHSGRSLKIYAKNLVTGGFAGPYLGSMTGHFVSSDASLDPTGRIALASYKFNRYKFKRRSRLFSQPLSTTPFLDSVRGSSLRFCGTHLVSFTNNSATEVDPSTLAPIARIVPKFSDVTTNFYLDRGCNQSYLYTYKPTHAGNRVTAYPLG